MSTNLTDQLLTIEQAGELLGLGAVSIRRMVKRGELQVIRINVNVVRIAESELARFIESKKV